MQEVHFSHWTVRQVTYSDVLTTVNFDFFRLKCFPLKSQFWSLDFMLLCHCKYFHHLDSDSSTPATKWAFKLQPLIHNPIACPFHRSFFPFLGHKWGFPFMGHKWDYLSSFVIILCLWCIIIVHILTFSFTNIKKNFERYYSTHFCFYCVILGH